MAEEDLLGCRQRRGSINVSIFLYMNLWLCLLQIHQHISADSLPHIRILSYNCTNTIGNYTQDSLFHTYLSSIIPLSAADIQKYGFNRTLGGGVDQVTAMAYCWAELDPQWCSECINDAANNLTKVCPNQKEAIGWYDRCMFRYSNNNFIGNMSLTPFNKQINSTLATNAYVFSRNLSSLADRLLEQASSLMYNRLPSQIIYTLQMITTPDGQHISGLMQCTPDTNNADCMECLNHTKNELLSCCGKNVAGIYQTPNCYFRFDHSNPFVDDEHLYFNTGKRTKSKKIIIVVSAIVALLVLTLSLCVYITRQRWQKANTRHKGEEDEELLKTLRTETTQYDFASISAATEGFLVANMLGRGGFGEVYKGVLSDGKEIAVKRLSTTSGQGDKEFENEVLLLARLQHTCLVKLLGFCLEGKERLLVYEFMANGSLDKFIFATDLENRSRLDWEERYRIIKSIARGLVYLHEDSRLMIIHRDLKTSNILLDGDMNAKISDFGMARLFDRDEGEVITKRIAGTLGYMAPEYAMHGLFSMKSDVYSFGVLLLEVVSGKRNYYSLTEESSEGLLSYAYKTWKEGKASDLIDPMLTAGSDSLKNMMRCIHIALLCVQDNVGSRPTMASVNLMIQSLTITLPIPFEPGFFYNYTRSRLSEIPESTVHYDPLLNEETDSYLYPR